MMTPKITAPTPPRAKATGPARKTETSPFGLRLRRLLGRVRWLPRLLRYCRRIQTRTCRMDGVVPVIAEDRNWSVDRLPAVGRIRSRGARSQFRRSDAPKSLPAANGASAPHDFSGRGVPICRFFGQHAIQHSDQFVGNVLAHVAAGSGAPPRWPRPSASASVV